MHVFFVLTSASHSSKAGFAAPCVGVKQTKNKKKKALLNRLKMNHSKNSTMFVALILYGWSYWNKSKFP